LRHHVEPEVDVGKHDIDAAIHYLDVVEGIVIAEDIVPDRIAYTIMIQGFAYHGNLIQALHVFTHMLSSSDLEPYAPRTLDEDGELVPTKYPTTLPVFRALFLGFARHAQSPLPKDELPLTARLKTLSDPSVDDWTMWHLSCLFKTFLELPADTRPSDRTIYWILFAFAKSSGNDKGKLRHVWVLLERRFGGGWGGRLERFRKKIFSEIPDGLDS
jgi:pentatricopeptide repeat protein